MHVRAQMCVFVPDTCWSPDWAEHRFLFESMEVESAAARAHVSDSGGGYRSKTHHRFARSTHHNSGAGLSREELITTGDRGRTFASRRQELRSGISNLLGVSRLERRDSELANSQPSSTSVIFSVFKKFGTRAAVPDDVFFCHLPDGNNVYTVSALCGGTAFSISRHFADRNNIAHDTVSGGPSSHSVIGGDGSCHALHWFVNGRYPH